MLTSTIASILQMRKRRHRELQELIQSHVDGKDMDSQDLNPGSVAIEFVLIQCVHYTRMIS